MTLDKNKLTRTIIVSPGSKYVDTQLIPTHKIYVPKDASGKTLNRARKKYLNQNHINLLAESFKKGIDYSKHPPIVVKKHQIIDGIVYEYELIGGAHRFEAMAQSGITEWLFDIYELGINGIAKDLAMSTLQIRENDHSPALASSSDDLINILGYLINKKLIDNTEDAIENYLIDNTKNIHPSTFKKVVSAAVNANGSYSDIRTWPADQLRNFIEKDFDRKGYVCLGKFDSEREKYGFTVLEGYEYEYLTNALKKFNETDKGSYFICHTKAPTEDRNLETRRNEMLQEIKTLENAIEKAVKYKEKNKKWPWHIEAFLGQNVKDKEKNFLSINEI